MPHLVTTAVRLAELHATRDTMGPLTPLGDFLVDHLNTYGSGDMRQLCTFRMLLPFVCVMPAS